MVVVQALRDVQDPFARQPEALEEDLEVVRVRLVAAALLRGHDPVEVDAEPRSRPEQVVVAVREHAQAEARLEQGQRGRRVGERGPVPDRAAEPADLLVGRLGAVARRDTPPPTRGSRGRSGTAGLGGGLEARVRLEQLVVVEASPAARAPAQGGPGPASQSMSVP